MCVFFECRKIFITFANMNRKAVNIVVGVAAVVIVAAIYGCSRQRPQQMTVAESIYATMPDSALALLNTVDRNDLSGENLARYCLYYYMSQDKSGLDVDNDSLIRTAYDYYSRHADDSLYARCHYYMGKYYLLSDSTKQCEDCLLLALNTAEKQKDYFTAYLSAEKLSRSIAVSDHQAAINYARKACNLYQLCDKNLDNEIYLLLNFGLSFLHEQEADSCFKYLNYAEELLPQVKDSFTVTAIYQGIAAAYDEIGEYEKGLHYAELMKKSAPSMYNSQKYMLSLSYVNTNNIEKAKPIFFELLQQNDNEMNYNIYNILLNDAITNNHKEQAISYAKSMRESLMNMYQHVIETKAQYFQDNIKKEVEKEAIKYKEKIKVIFILGISCFIIIITICIFLLMYHNKREKHRLEIKHREEQISMMRHYIQEKINLMSELQKDNKIKTAFCDSDWENLASYLNATDNNFVNRLRTKYPKTTDEIAHFCMLLKINLSNEDIARMYNITPKSVKQRCYLYKTNFDLSSSDVSLRNFIAKF